MNFDYLNNEPSIDQLLTGVSCISQSQGLTMCLELLGSRSNDLTAVVPVNATPDVLAGVLRAGANPMLVDIDPSTLTLSAHALEQVLQNQEDNIVICLPIVGGCGIPASIKEILKEQIVIIIYKELPTKVPYYGLEVFSLYDLSPYLGSGAVIRTKFDKQRLDLAVNRDSPFGMHNSIPSVLHKSIDNILNSNARHHAQTIVEIYQDKLFDYSIHLNTSITNNFLIKVEDAFSVLDRLTLHGIEAKLGCFPLYNLDSIGIHGEVEPGILYPIAHGLSTKVISLPTHLGISVDDANYICDIVRNKTQ